MKTPLFAPLLSTIVIASSCNYEPSKEVFTSLQEPTGEGLSINLNNYPNKDIEVKKEMYITYTIQNLGRPIIGTQITIDGTPVYSTNDLSGYISISPGQWSTGVHVLRVEALLQSGTGSLAEKFAGERIILWTERNLHVDHDVPDDPSDPNALFITSVEEVDNTIVVHWNKYSKFNFTAYYILRSDYDENGALRGTYNFNGIEDPEQTSVIDPSYLYGRSTYQVNLYADGKNYTSPPFEYNRSFDPKIEASVDFNGDLSLKWSSIGSLSKNFLTYSLSVSRKMGNTGGYIGSFLKADAKDTTLTLHVPDFKLGQWLSVRLDYLSTSNWIAKTVSARVAPGEPFAFIGPFANLHYDVTTDHFYANMFDYGQPRINKIDKNGVSVDSASMYFQSWAFATDVPFAVGTAGQRSYKIDLVTMDSELMPSVPTIDNVLNVSDNMRMFYARVNDQTTMIYNQAGQTLLAPTTLGGSYISADGNYTLLSSDIYKFNGTTFDVWSTPRPGVAIWYGVRMGDPKLVLLTYFDRMDVYDLETKSVVNSTSNFHTYCNFDPVSQKFGCNLDDLFVILNSDLTQYKSMIKDRNVRFFLLNETVLCSGSQIKLSDIP